MAFEHELKLRVASLDAGRDRLRSRGATLRHPVAHEDNWVLDDGHRSIAGRGCLLRVRQWGDDACITYKGPARFAAGIKTREELETTLGSAAVALEVLAALGLTPWRRYQKRREVWELDGVIVALDETPIGCFVELEGEPEAIAQVAAALGLDPAHALAGTYLHLWEEYRAAHPEAGEHMVFVQDLPPEVPE